MLQIMETKQSSYDGLTAFIDSIIVAQNCWLNNKTLNSHLTKKLHASSLVISELMTLLLSPKRQKRQKYLTDILKTFLCFTNKLMKYVWTSCTCQKEIHI